MIAGAAVALLWLAARRRLYAQRGLSLATGPLLALQIALVAAAEACLVAAPLAALVSEPRGVELLVRISGHPFGWLAWALALSAVAVDVWQTAVRQLLHVLCSFLLAAGVLVGCSLVAWRGEAWLAYHTVTAAWTALDAIVLCTLVYVRWVTRSRFAHSAEFASAYHTELSMSPIASIEAWLSAIGLAVVGLAIRGAWDDPRQPYWSAGAVLAVSVMAAATALLLNKWRYVYASGLLVNVAGSAIWLAWARHAPFDLALVNAACFAAAAIGWTMLGIVLTPVASAEDRGWPRYEHLATQAGLAILAAVVAVVLAADALDEQVVLHHKLAALAWGLAAAASLVSLWDGAGQVCAGQRVRRRFDWHRGRIGAARVYASRAGLAWRTGAGCFRVGGGRHRPLEW